MRCKVLVEQIQRVVAPFMDDRAVALRLVPGYKDAIILLPDTTAQANRRVFGGVVEPVHPAAWVEAVGCQDLNISALHQLQTTEDDLAERHKAIGRIVEEIRCRLEASDQLLESASRGNPL